MAVVFCAVSAASLPAAPPNVVLIIGDDQAWTDFGFMGHDVIRTPNLDRLAGQSLLFTRGYVPSSLCRPSLATIITGLYPHQHKITSNDPPRGTDRQLMLRHIDAAPTLPRLLARLGYRSLQTGKWWEGSHQRGGFTEGMTHGDPKRGGRHGDNGLKIGREGLEPIFEFIKDCRGKPFFVWYAPFLPHTPHNPPPRLFDKYNRPGRSPHVARYWAMCEWFDETCGALIDYLDDQHLSERTLVVFVTDNGWIQQQNRGGYAPKSKRSPYDGGLRTPIMFRWLGTVEPRRDEQTLAVSIDLAPTVLAACGVEALPTMQGIDLLQAAGREPQRDTIFGEVFTHDAVDIDDPASSLLFRWCVRGSSKLILPNRSEAQPELYDLANDPHETRNLAGQQAERATALAGAINRWWPAERNRP
jgi:uncharacterized sulfatase